ncbi:MAG: response regulator [Bdellovibrionota bacterium]
MPAILIVDDESDYRDELSGSFTRAGYSVYTASDAEQAVELAANLRPDVLIVDWLLRNSVDGLTLAAALKVMLPSLAVIAITGFGSKDLRSEANAQEIFGYIEKPFGLGVIHDYVREALKVAQQANQPVREPIGVVVTDLKGSLQHYNPAFHEMVDIPERLLRRVAFDDILELPGERFFKKAATSWVHVSANSRLRSEIILRMRRFERWETLLFVVLEEAEEEYRQNSLVKLLIGQSASDAQVQTANHFLLVDRKMLSRRLMTEELRKIGLVCHAATTLDEALPLIDKDQSLSVVIVDSEIPSEEIRRALDECRRVRPEILFVGTGHGAKSEYFESCGVQHFMPKPWEWADLQALIENVPSA